VSGHIFIAGSTPFDALYVIRVLGGEPGRLDGVDHFATSGACSTGGSIVRRTSGETVGPS
jgi:hypothetical protein